MFVLVPVCVLTYMYEYQCVVTCFPVSKCNLIVNRLGPQTMRQGCHSFYALRRFEEELQTFLRRFVKTLHKI